MGKRRRHAEEFKREARLSALCTSFTERSRVTGYVSDVVAETSARCLGSLHETRPSMAPEFIHAEKANFGIADLCANLAVTTCSMNGLHDTSCHV